MKYHVVQGALKAADVAKLSEAKTLEGQPIAIAVKGDKTQINDATVTKPDLETANGVIHTIDRVLVPPELRKEVVCARSCARPGATRARPLAQVQGTAQPTPPLSPHGHRRQRSNACRPSGDGNRGGFQRGHQHAAHQRHDGHWQHRPADDRRQR